MHRPMQQDNYTLKKGRRFMKRFIGLMVAGMVMLAGIGGACASEKDEATALVKKAAAYFKANGKEKLIAEINNPHGQFVKGELYLFANDFNGLMLAHGSNPKLIGKNLSNLKDPDGKVFFVDLAKMAKQGGGWTDYRWSNPVTKKVEAKTTYSYQVGDFFVACGIYK